MNYKQDFRCVPDDASILWLLSVINIPHLSNCLKVLIDFCHPHLVRGLCCHPCALLISCTHCACLPLQLSIEFFPKLCFDWQSKETWLFWLLTATVCCDDWDNPTNRRSYSFERVRTGGWEEGWVGKVLAGQAWEPESGSAEPMYKAECDYAQHCGGCRQEDAQGLLSS